MKAENMSAPMPPNKSMQTDQTKLSHLLYSQEPRQLTLAADLGRYAAGGLC